MKLEHTFVDEWPHRPDSDYLAGLVTPGRRSVQRRIERGANKHLPPAVTAFQRGLADANREWVRDAACRGLSPALFYPRERPGRLGSDELYVEPRKVCAGCAVRVECADYGAMFGNGHGMWGGLAPREVRAHRKYLRAK